MLAAAGEPDVKEKLLKGHEAAGKTFKVHLDGYNQLPYLTGQAEKSPRQGFFYFNDDGDLVALRYENWKVVFMEQRAPGTLRVWAEPFTPLRLPKLFDLRADPYERADITSNTYYDWLISQPYLIFAAQAAIGEVPGDLQGVPAPPAGRELQHRPGRREDAEDARCDEQMRSRQTILAALGSILAVGCAGVSAQVQPVQQIANPASQNCVARGGMLRMESRPDGGQYGVCVFDDNYQCEEWAMYRGECPVGGLRVTGYITTAARYCAITGGGRYTVVAKSGAADERGACALPGGKACDADASYAGTCGR